MTKEKKKWTLSMFRLLSKLVDVQVVLVHNGIRYFYFFILIKLNSLNKNLNNICINIYFQGYVTTYRPQDLKMLKKLMSSVPEPIVKAGLHPTAEQIEMYAYHLPDAPLSNLVVILFINT